MALDWKDWINHWADFLRCPYDQSPLQASTPEDPGQLNGQLGCPKCERRYPVREGVIDFLVGRELNELQESEKNARNDAADAYSEYEPYSDLYELPALLEAMAAGPEDTVIDLGCGTGRMTRLFVPNVQRTIALDLSRQAVLRLGRRLSPELLRRTLLIAGDLTAPPLAPGLCTRAVSSQVLEHLPTAELRSQAFRAAADLLAPGGTLTCTLFNWSVWKQRDARRGVGDYTRKEGLHCKGIYYYNYTAPEMREILSAAGLTTEYIHGSILGIPGSRLLGPLVHPLKRWLSKTFLGPKLGYLLLCHARKPVTQAGGSQSMMPTSAKSSRVETLA